MPDFYGDLAGFKAYWVARGNALVTAYEDDDILASLLVASEYLDAAFRTQFMGWKVGGRPQVREWPRSAVIDIYGYGVDSTIVPPEIEQATYQAALRQHDTPGIFFKDYTPSKYKSVSISGAVDVEWAIGSAFDFQTQLPSIGAILTPILTGEGSGGMSPLSGSTSRV